jgi:hypothetical protein
MMKRKVVIFAMAAVVLCAANGFGAVVSDFDDLTLGAGSYWNGADESGGFSSGGASYNTFYDPAWGSWAGFGYSNRTDTVTPGWDGEFNAIAGGGQSGDNYAVGYYDTYNMVTPTLTLDTASIVDGAFITNTNWLYYFVLDGDDYFGELSYGVGDWALLTITGKDASDADVGTKEFYLADYRTGTEMVDSWEYVDLSDLGIVSSLEFAVTSNRGFTPSYFAIDTVVPEPVSLALLGVGCMFVRNRRNSKR